MKQSFTFNTFSNGLSNDPTKWKTHGYYSAGLDLVGIKSITNITLGGRPNALQLALPLALDSVSATGAGSNDTHLTGLVQWIRRWDSVSAGDLWALEPVTSASNPGVILRKTTTTNKWVSSHRVLVTSGWGGLEKLSACMYYGQDAVLGQITSANAYNDSFGTFTKGGQTPRPMKIFAGVLNIGNDNYISTVDSIQQFTAAALTLPSGFVVRSLEVLGNYLVISADNGIFSRIFLWTGGTATYQEAYDLPESNAPILVSKDGKVFAIGRGIYALSEVNFSTVYPKSFNADIPTPRTTGSVALSPGSTATWQNNIIYGLSELAAAVTSGNQNGGVHLLGQYDSTYPFVPALTFLVPNQILSAATYIPAYVELGGLYGDYNGVLEAGFKDENGSANVTSAQYGIATVSYTRLGGQNYTYYLTLPLTMDTDGNKLFHSVRLNMQGLTTNTNLAVDVSYRLDTDFSASTNLTNLGAWVFLRTVKPSDGGSQLLNIPIRKRGRNIMFKFLFYGSTTTRESPQLLGYDVVYEHLDLYR